MDTSNTAAITNYTVSIKPTAPFPVMTTNEVDGSSDVVPKKRYDKANIRALIDAAIRASLHAEQCGVQARSAFDKYTLSLAHFDNVETYAAEARRTFDVYTVAVTTSLEKAATSDAAILEMTVDIENRIEALSVEQ